MARRANNADEQNDRAKRVREENEPSISGLVNLLDHYSSLFTFAFVLARHLEEPIFLQQGTLWNIRLSPARYLLFELPRISVWKRTFH